MDLRPTRAARAVARAAGHRDRVRRTREGFVDTRSGGLLEPRVGRAGTPRQDGLSRRPFRGFRSDFEGFRRFAAGLRVEPCGIAPPVSPGLLAVTVRKVVPG